MELLHFQLQSLSHCELITDEGIRHLGTSPCAAENLTVLELDNCPLITDASLEHLISCHNLQRIELYDCQLITRAGIRRLRVLLVLLQYSFRFQFCDLSANFYPFVISCSLLFECIVFQRNFTLYSHSKTSAGSVGYFFPIAIPFTLKTQVNSADTFTKHTCLNDDKNSWEIRSHFN